MSERRPSDVRLQKVYCEMLWKCAQDGESNARVVAAGGVEAVAFAMSEHPGEVDVQSPGEKALCMLVPEADGKADNGAVNDV